MKFSFLTWEAMRLTLAKGHVDVHEVVFQRQEAHAAHVGGREEADETLVLAFLQNAQLACLFFTLGVDENHREMHLPVGRSVQRILHCLQDLQGGHGPGGLGRRCEYEHGEHDRSRTT
jgi:hypothetical protein